MKEKIMGTFSAGMASMKKSMQSGVDSYKLEGKIAEQQKKIKALTKEIGNLAIIRLEAGDEMSPEIMERYHAILEAKAEIETLEKERRVLKIACPNCGTKTSVKMNFCGKCGAALKEAEDMEDIVEIEEFFEAEDMEEVLEAENTEETIEV